ncbi:uncharacterized protein [Blastocystis hominis]|uniref:Uncharacterized protein n=1 Tax=Blastocystis hominis TaxID=12968 RepID=D8M9S6_BLAHO|nr:uncharacterized protein [Blastocystis hominis]CBK24815.2 unnamed protein product [Blastocystis hominis]|eukprot:XP_012898863.1 uncharacterized protein [Blastocystis hominis]
MSFIAGLTGCCIGLLTKLYSNSLRKLPYMREPWEHLIYMGVGGFSFYYAKKFIDREKNSLRTMLVDLDREDVYGTQDKKIE